jgi:hypothetical protein
MFAALPSIRIAPQRVAALVAAGLVVYTGALVAAGIQTQPDSAAAEPVAQVARIPWVEMRPSRGVDSNLDRRTAVQIAADVVVDLQRRRPAVTRLRRITLWLEAGSDQFPVIVARLEGTSRGPDGGQSPLEETVAVAPSRSGYRVVRIRHS